MAKYRVEVGGFVTVFRCRKLIVHADNEAEAEQKAVDKFINLQCENGDCDDARVDNVELIDYISPL